MKINIAGKNIPLLTTILVFCILFTGASIFLKGFFSPQVFINLFSENAFLGIAALGMSFVILSGGIDLSVGAMIGFSSILLSRLIMDVHIHPLLAFLIILFFGIVLGTAMGCLIHFFNQPPFLITLAGMFLARGLGFVIKMEAMPIRHDFFKQLHALSLPIGDSAFIPFYAFIFGIMAVLTWYISVYTRFGRNIYALGGNEQSALLMGVPIRRVKIGVYAFSGFCASLAGIIYSLYTFSGNPTAGTTLELDAIAAVVIGGTPLSGGIGSPVGTVIGVLILGIIQTSIMFEGSLSSWWTRIVVGILLLIFILLQNLIQRKL